MPPDTTQPSPQVMRSDGGLVIRLPQSLASPLQLHLKDHGIPTTLIFRSWADPAVLEVWPGPDEAAVRRAVEAWEGVRP